MPVVVVQLQPVSLTLAKCPTTLQGAQMEGKIMLDKMLADCEIGVQKSVTVLVTPTANDKTHGFEADVDEVVDYEEEGGDESTKDAKEGGEPAEGKSMGKSMSKMAPAARRALTYE